ncbi:hypothetical protein KUTeg_000160 [Tegillarca granosa]|uniref:SSD domain-containing protein n=1 Tax=Tegillarca granosa TaxID=220873 RepID=A0ABQ9FWW1_TEGGR|nr:hypothetical protein KUTeg_000160 [Tegillarca granosa]
MLSFTKFEDTIRLAFYRYGLFIAKRPWTAIIIAILINGLLGINIMWMKRESNLENLFTPTNSKAKTDRQWVLSQYQDHTGNSFYEHSLREANKYGEVIVKSLNGQNLLNETLYAELESLNEVIRNASITSGDGIKLRYEDICARRDNICVVDGLIVFSEYFRIRYQNDDLPFPLLKTEDGNIVSLKRVFGNATVLKGKLKGASLLKLKYNLRQNGINKQLSQKWEEAFLNTLAVLKNKHYDIAYSNSESLDSELGANTGGDAGYFKWTFTLMITYVSFATAGGNFVSNRAHIGRASVIGAGLAILGAFGFACAASVPFENIVGVMPFLILGIDNVFILLSNLADISYEEPVEERVAKTMKTCGIAITVTMVTNMIAFVVGYLSVFLSVRIFCIYTEHITGLLVKQSVAVVLCYFNFMTFVLGSMTLNEKRTLCDVSTSPYLRRDERKGVVWIKNIFCSGDIPESREDIESRCDRVPNRIFPMLVLYFPCKIIIILLFLTYLGFAIWGSTQLEQGLVISNLVSEDSYLYKYSQWQSHYFSSEIPIAFVIKSNTNYSNSNTVWEIQKLIRSAKSDPDINNDFEIDWSTEYQRSKEFDNSTENNYVKSLKNIFLPKNPKYLNDIVFNDAGDRIKTSRIYVMTTDIKNSLSQGKMMLRMRDIAEHSNLEVFAYSPAFIYFEQYIAVLPNTLQTVGIAIAAVFIVTSIFMPNVLLIIFVTLSMTMIMVGVFGFMYFWDLSLSSITMIHVIMSVGFSVDFSTHICHAFMTAEGTDRNSRVYVAMIRSGGPIFNSGMSSILGILLLYLSRSYVFRSFFKVMLLVVIFGQAHAVLLLPVILSWIGPNKPFTKTEKSDSKNSSAFKSVYENKSFNSKL